MDWEILTERQREILLLLAEGWLLGEIAERENYAPRTIRAELRDIYSALSLRLGRRNPACAIYKAWYFGEIVLPEYLTNEERENATIYK